MGTVFCTWLLREETAERNSYVTISFKEHCFGQSSIIWGPYMFSSEMVYWKKKPHRSEWNGPVSDNRKTKLIYCKKPMKPYKSIYMSFLQNIWVRCFVSDYSEKQPKQTQRSLAPLKSSETLFWSIMRDWERFRLRWLLEEHNGPINSKYLVYMTCCQILYGKLDIRLCCPNEEPILPG